jgi:hypothetical protein
MSFLTELEKIEQRLEQEGDTKQVRTAFWRIISKIKRQDPRQITDATIDKAAKIRNQLFSHDVILSTSKGLGLFFLIALIAFIGIIQILLFFDAWLASLMPYDPFVFTIILNVFLVIGSILLAYGVYPWGRYFGGVIARIKFDGFYRYSPGELGLKIEYTSYLKTTQSRRKWVFGLPVFWVFGFFFILLPITWFLKPSGIWGPFIMIILFGIFYPVIYRRKTGELYRFVRELRIAREVKQKQKQGAP